MCTNAHWETHNLSLSLCICHPGEKAPSLDRQQTLKDTQGKTGHSTRTTTTHWHFTGFNGLLNAASLLWDECHDLAQYEAKLLLWRWNTAAKSWQILNVISRLQPWLKLSPKSASNRADKLIISSFFSHHGAQNQGWLRSRTDASDMPVMNLKCFLGPRMI